MKDAYRFKEDLYGPDTRVKHLIALIIESTTSLAQLDRFFIFDFYGSLRPLVGIVSWTKDLTS